MRNISIVLLCLIVSAASFAMDFSKVTVQDKEILVNALLTVTKNGRNETILKLGTKSYPLGALGLLRVRTAFFAELAKQTEAKFGKDKSKTLINQALSSGFLKIEDTLIKGQYALKFGESMIKFNLFEADDLDLPANLVRCLLTGRTTAHILNKGAADARPKVVQSEDDFEASLKNDLTSLTVDGSGNFTNKMPVNFYGYQHKINKGMTFKLGIADFKNFHILLFPGQVVHLVPHDDFAGTSAMQDIVLTSKGNHIVINGKVDFTKGTLESFTVAGAHLDLYFKK